MTTAAFSNNLAQPETEIVLPENPQEVKTEIVPENQQKAIAYVKAGRLRSLLTNACKGISLNPEHPVLGYLLIEVSQTHLTATSNSLAYGVKAWVELERSSTPFQVLLTQPKQMASICSMLDGQYEVGLSLEKTVDKYLGEQLALVLETVTGEFKIRSIEPSQFIEIDALDAKAGQLNIPFDLFRAGIEGGLLAASREEVSDLGVVKFEAVGGEGAPTGGGKIRFTATDGHKISRVSWQVAATQETEALIPIGAITVIRDLVTVANCPGQLVYVQVEGEKAARLATVSTQPSDQVGNGLKFTFRIKNKNSFYPPVEKFLGQPALGDRYFSCIEVEARRLATALDLMLIASVKATCHLGGQKSPTGDKLFLYALSNEKSFGLVGMESLDVSLSGQECKFSIDGKLLATALHFFGAVKVCLWVANGIVYLLPAVFDPAVPFKQQIVALKQGETPDVPGIKKGKSRKSKALDAATDSKEPETETSATVEEPQPEPEVVTPKKRKSRKAKGAQAAVEKPPAAVPETEPAAVEGEESAPPDPEAETSSAVVEGEESAPDPEVETVSGAVEGEESAPDPDAEATAEDDEIEPETKKTKTFATVDPHRVSSEFLHVCHLKAKNPDSILFYLVGDFYECYLEDAELVCKELEIVLTSRNVGKDPIVERVKMTGIPAPRVDHYTKQLTDRNLSVCVVSSPF